MRKQASDFVEEIRNIDWKDVTKEQDPGTAVEIFDNLLTKVINKHAPMRKQAVRNVASPWLDKELKERMRQRDKLKLEAIKTNQLETWCGYRKIRNIVTKLNKNKKQLYYQRRIIEAKLDHAKVWGALNELMRVKERKAPTVLEADGVFLTKPKEIADYLKQFFINKIKTLNNTREERKDENTSYQRIKDDIMQMKDCEFKFMEVSEDYIKKLILNSKDKPPGMDDIDIRLLKLVVDFILLPVSHIINISFNQSIFPAQWKKAKVIPLIKNNREPLSGKNSRPISLLPALSKILERVAYEQIQEYFITNRLNTIYQHAYKAGHSTTTALAQITDHWLEEIDDKKLVGTIFLDLSAAFDVIDHKILLKKL
uniref:Reverse transcriptase domain-containing protein n=1 Tax=Nothobranchius pienaari TaxID=704102 RepID=A0A1A8N7A3_9TELE